MTHEFKVEVRRNLRAAVR